MLSTTGLVRKEHRARRKNCGMRDLAVEYHANVASRAKGVKWQSRLISIGRPPQRDRFGSLRWIEPRRTRLALSMKRSPSRWETPTVASPLGVLEHRPFPSGDQRLCRNDAGHDRVRGSVLRGIHTHRIVRHSRELVHSPGVVRRSMGNDMVREPEGYRHLARGGPAGMELAKGNRLIRW